MQTKPRDMLRGTALTALGMVLKAYSRAEKPPTVREVARSAGVSIRSVQKALLKLRRLGLVTWKGKSHGTLTPTCYFTAV